ncbi:MAG TPA: alpha/beta fold hydrolase [Woeseiaceae bacterium]|jgi:predicted alpha/beta-hydrolase family hydrolase|nr:alpha/beta fold hydrolase [Woeseiaceae bacterium]
MRILWQCSTEADVGLVLAHGAGAGMTHGNMQALADAFGRERIATLRFDFPFIEAGRRRVDSKSVATDSIAEAYAEASRRTALPLWLGGHSFGGRIASHAVTDGGIEPRGLIFCSFPLHASRKPGTERAAHLAAIDLPMLFLSGTRDALAARTLLESVVSGLNRAELHWLDTADHGYRVLKRSRATDENVFDEMARVARGFIDRCAKKKVPD